VSTHDLKSWPDFFAPILDGTKTFEVRIDDRGFKVGDILNLWEWDDRKRAYTGRSIQKQVTYILKKGSGQGGIAPRAGLQTGYVVMSLADVAGEQ
jgi:Domain of unknown function (DUF3850)